MSDAKLIADLQKQLDAMLKFPDQNPNPVLKVNLDGGLLYSNTGGESILSAWGIEVGEQVPKAIMEHEITADYAPLELPVGNRTYSFHIVPVPAFGFVNIYGTDITAMKAITKFPDQNPNPVLKMNMEGILLYSNTGGKSILSAWGIEVGERVPAAVLEHEITADYAPLELPVGNRTYSFHIVPVPAFGFVNIYGTDITAMKAITKFPDQNPNPVLKMNMEGILLYSNTGGKSILSAWGIEVGERVPVAVLDHEITADFAPLELPVGNRTYSFHIVPVPAFGFVNIYGTDITAMKAITKFPDQNPNPVLKMNMEGILLYSNVGGQPILSSWNTGIGDKLPDSMIEHAGLNTTVPLELEVGQKTYMFHIVPVPEFGFVNIYGTDVSAARDNEQILLKLAKYFSPQVYESIFSGDLEVKIQTKRKRLTVFFSDIKGFSEITERLEPEVLTELITEYLTAMTNIAVKHGGTVDKYIGDAIMVFFGDPKSRGHKEDALACVRMALDMKEALWEIRKAWRDKGISQPLDIRIGIHTDTCTVGNFGSYDRLDYTTIGNGVNLASRLESNARPNQILISEDTFLLIRDQIHCKKLNKIQVKNIKHPIQTYEVRGTEEAAISSHELNVKEEGFTLFIDPENIQDVAQKTEALENALKLLQSLR